MAEVRQRTAERLGFRFERRSVPQDDRSALVQILAALDVKDYELEDDGMLSAEEMLTGILRPRGIMMRRIRLKGKWWNECVGPLLGYTKDGRLVALTQTLSGLGYQYRDSEGFIRKVSHKEMAENLKAFAYTFTKPLPFKSLGVKDLLKFSWGTIGGPNVLMLIVSTLIVLLLGMFTPMANKLIFDTVIPTGDAADLLPITGLLAGAVIGTVLMTFTRNLYVHRIRNIVELHTQNAIMARTFLLSPTFFSKNPSGELSAKLNNVTKLCGLINEGVVGTLLSGMLSIIYLIQVWIYGGKLILPVMVIMTLQVLLLLYNYRIAMAVNRKHTEHAARLSGLEYNMFAGIQKLKLSGSEKRAFTRWLDNYSEHAQLIYNPRTKEIVFQALTLLVTLGGAAFIFWYTLSLGIAPSDYIAFSSAFGLMTAAVSQMHKIIPEMSKAQPLLESVKPILEAVPEMEAKAPQVEDLFGSIEVSGLSFRYQEDGPLILDNLDLKIEPGEYVGIVGKSGCGKSTLMRLLLGFEQPLSGGIYYDNYDLSKVDKTSLRRKIGCCLQSGSLFTGDIFHNVTITAPWATQDDAWEALRMASLDEDVKRMPMHMHTLVSEGGGGFSGGQKQRILIARALISKPEIIFFDEATSALDNISQKQVSDNLDQLNCTRLVIAHRLSTIRHCDRIIVLDKGRIAEEGNFEQLMEKKGLFYEMSLRQL